MARTKTFRTLFKRYRRPGDIVFAWACLLVSAFLLSQIATETAWRPGAKLAAQPRFWPAVSLGGMVFFSALHLISSAMSERIDGRWKEVTLWLSALEFAGWFVAYAVVVPYAGYLPSTILFMVLLTVRLGYRSRAMILAAMGAAVAIVVLFKSFLQVKLPAGQVYSLLPDGLRQFMLTYF